MPWSNARTQTPTARCISRDVTAYLSNHVGVRKWLFCTFVCRTKRKAWWRWTTGPREDWSVLSWPSDRGLNSLDRSFTSSLACCLVVISEQRHAVFGLGSATVLFAPRIAFSLLESVRRSRLIAGIMNWMRLKRLSLMGYVPTIKSSKVQRLISGFMRTSFDISSVSCSTIYAKASWWWSRGWELHMTASPEKPYHMLSWVPAGNCTC